MVHEDGMVQSMMESASKTPTMAFLDTLKRIPRSKSTRDILKSEEAESRDTLGRNSSIKSFFKKHGGVSQSVAESPLKVKSLPMERLMPKKELG